MEGIIESFLSRMFWRWEKVGKLMEVLKFIICRVRLFSEVKRIHILPLEMDKKMNLEYTD